MYAVSLQVGKSTLIKCLVKHYTKQNLAEVKGPITVVAGVSIKQHWDIHCPGIASAHLCDPHSIFPACMGLLHKCPAPSTSACVYEAHKAYEDQAHEACVY